MARKKSNATKMGGMVLMGLLFVGLAGFGATNFSGTIRSIGSVGDKELGVDQYARALQEDLRAFEAQVGQSLSFQQAQAFGLDRQTLSRLITTRALDHEAAQLGISVGDETLAQQMRQIGAFNGPDGQFDREAYRYALDNSGLTEAQLEEQMREETARTLLQAAIVAGNRLPDTYSDTLVNFLAERRSFTWARLGQALLTEDVPAADDAAVQAYYDENIADYTLPETRRVTYAWLTPEMMVDAVEVDDAILREQYEARNDEFNQPERRLLERLVFSDESAASQAMAQIEVGGTTFQALVEDRGLTLTDVDLGDVAAEDLDVATATAVFTAREGDVVGPLPSSLGPALFRVNGILAAQETPFEEVRDMLAEDEAILRARRLIENQAESMNDMLAGGATLEELAQETDMELGQIDWYTGVEQDIAAYGEFGDAVQQLTTEDFPEVALLEDGAIYAMRLDEIVAPRPQPLADVREEVIEAVTNQRKLTALEALAEEKADMLRDLRTFATLGLQTNETTEYQRGGFVDGMPQLIGRTAFDMEQGQVTTVTEGNFVYILRLDAIQGPEAGNPDVDELRQTVEDQIASGVAEDLFQAYANDIRQRAGLELDQQAIKAVHAQFQ